MDPEEEQQPTGDTSTTGDAASGVAIAASLAGTPTPEAAPATPPADVIRNSPEYQALQEQNRTLAREAGNYRTQLEQQRQREAAAQQAAEAEQVEAMRLAMADALGDNVQAFSEFANLLQSDPVAAARQFANFQAQSQEESEEPEPPAAPTQEPEVPVVPTPPVAPARGVSASQPLGQPASQSTDDLVAHLDESVERVVEANQKLSTRARVTGRIRETAIGQFLQSSYIKQMGGSEPMDLTVNQRRR